MDELEKAFFETFGGRLLSGQHKQALKKLLQDTNPDEHKKALLRSCIFDWVASELKEANSQQLLSWLEEANKLLAATRPTVTEQVYFSPGEACLEAITNHMQQAVHTIDICVFTISDNRITGQIIASHQAGKRVQIITDNEKLYDTGSDIKQLADAGIPVMIDRTSNHMHHKFAIIDSRLVLTGSYNWTRSAAAYNHENILVTSNRQVVDSFEKEFSRLWQELEMY
jgi:phosphatidylserine/phosphatidylglycerophosphate/cardiolipin synthase-like enzyme